MLPSDFLWYFRCVKSLVISRTIVINSQHEPKLKHKFIEELKSTTKIAVICVNRTIKYPPGVFQLNGNLQIYQNIPTIYLLKTVF